MTDTKFNLKKIINSFSKKEDNSEKILRLAHKKSEKIVKKAVKKAENILLRGRIFDKELSKSLSEGMKEALTKEVGIFQKEIGSLINQSLADFRKLMDGQLKLSFKLLGSQVAEELAKTKEEIKKYKREKLKEIDRDINDKVDELSLKIVGESMSTKKRDMLVFEALKKAKDEGFFNF